MEWRQIIDGAQIWSLAIIGGPIILGLALAYAMMLRRRNTPDRAAPEYRRDEPNGR